jgi:hypothetical protein
MWLTPIAAASSARVGRGRTTGSGSAHFCRTRAADQEDGTGLAEIDPVQSCSGRGGEPVLFDFAEVGRAEVGFAEVGRAEVGRAVLDPVKTDIVVPWFGATI